MYKNLIVRIWYKNVNWYIVYKLCKEYKQEHIDEIYNIAEDNTE